MPLHHRFEVTILNVTMNLLLTVVLLAGLAYENNCRQLISPSQCWTQWFDRDDPDGTGDWESMSSLRGSYPGQICDSPIDMEVTTLSNVPAAATGDTFYVNDMDSGFVCRLSDQPSYQCHDYRVRFRCPSNFCQQVCWTGWYDRDDPSGTGDWELLANLQTENLGEICDDPVHIDVVTKNDGIQAFRTGQFFHRLSPSQGFACRNEDQVNEMCLDYKVRFGCPCPPVSPLTKSLIRAKFA
ncbi:uncharacterized protein LOC103380932 isoform X1 [Cynoglossus semilaevis]|uniref:uncharacterized protein LOC103380932 isoform X1 n=2 Tax=Cynoglossus semilaevis TaxID=244447 RepID=UPI000D62EC7D|nr:uncharacterized protein LOC103380932 isoform X1 [Cynoglossus semilaevis]